MMHSEAFFARIDGILHERNRTGKRVAYQTHGNVHLHIRSKVKCGCMVLHKFYDIAFDIQ
jgi:hypothetical protein